MRISKAKSNRVIRIYKGLPGCGKTTAARQLIASNPQIDFFRINNDDLSSAITNLSKGQIVDIVESLLAKAMAESKYVLIDNTNLSPTRVEAYEKIVAQWNEEHEDNPYEIVFEDLTDVPLWLCLERNALRPKPVPQHVITDMFKAHILPTLPCYNPDTTLPGCLVVDIDGTVAKTGNRNIYDFSKYHLDTPLLEIWKHIKAISATYDYQIVFLTGRSDDGRTETAEWLRDNLGIPLEEQILHMRPVNDHDADYKIKERIAINDILTKYHIAGWFEDRLRCVEMARYRLGIQAVYQLNEGQF